MLVAVAVAVASASSANASGAVIAATELSAGITARTQPVGIAPGPDGNLWFTEHGHNRIGRITPSGVVTHYRAGITSGAAPYAIAAGPDGNLWFTEAGLGRIGRITPSGAVTEFSAGITPNAALYGIAAGPDGNLWFADNDRIGRITPSGAVTEFSAGITEYAGPEGIAAGPDGNLWFTENGRGQIGRITPSGKVTEFRIPVASGEGFPRGPQGIAAGPDGNLWFTEYDADRIGRITPSGKVTEFSTGITSGAGPKGIAAGPDGNLWFTERWVSRIGRITPSGTVTQFNTGITRGAAPYGIAAGPDGNLWFTEFKGNRIGRISPPAGPILSVVKAGTGKGTVTSSPAGITCGTDCIGTFAAGTTASLRATPAAGSTFTGWTGCATTSGTSRVCKVPFTLASPLGSIAQSGPTSVTAAFASRRVHGNGRLLAPVLAYATRLKKEGKLIYRDFLVFFRSAGPITGRIPGGSYSPGAMRIADGVSRNEEYGDLGALGPGKPRGRCYMWALSASRHDGPKLFKEHAGNVVQVRFRLLHTTFQARTVRLRAWPSKGWGSPAVKRDVAKIGCPRL